MGYTGVTLACLHVDIAIRRQKTAEPGRERDDEQLTCADNRHVVGVRGEGGVVFSLFLVFCAEHVSHPISSFQLDEKVKTPRDQEEIKVGVRGAGCMFMSMFMFICTCTWACAWGRDRKVSSKKSCIVRPMCDMR